jgi:hypothetical protein
MWTEILYQLPSIYSSGTDQTVKDSQLLDTGTQDKILAVIIIQMEHDIRDTFKITAPLRQLYN